MLPPLLFFCPSPPTFFLGPAVAHQLFYSRTATVYQNFNPPEVTSIRCSQTQELSLSVVTQKAFTAKQF